MKLLSVDAEVDGLYGNVQFDGVLHHPMYDAVVAAQAWEQLF